jgi:glycine cleavage system aminomethyltransferase T/glycine/D-amino acid oxidase-like deaminating enzyme
MEKGAVEIPGHARVVIIGGGIIGCSIAYHLGQMGCKDVVLLERDELTCGTTWHAAGLMVTFGSLSETATKMRLYGRDLYMRLEAETGLATGFTPVGFIEAAADADRLEEYRRVAAFNRYCGVDVHEISPQEIQNLFPLARVEDLLAGFHVREDGRVNPVDATMSLAKGARNTGVRIIEKVPVTGLLKKNGAVAGVKTALGSIQADVVVNCAGMWARQIGAVDGITIPCQAAEHYYLITEELDDMPEQMPVLEDPSCYGYYREEVGGLMIGLFEPKCAPWQIGRVPDHFSFGEIPPDWDRMGPFLEKAMSRVPVTRKLGIRKFFCGPESFTPDLAPIIGEAPEVKNYFVAAGLNSVGIIMGPGLGRMMARWIMTGRPDVDITGFDIARLHTFQNNPDYRRHRTVESLGKVYQCHYPHQSTTTARGAKKSVLHDRLQAQGAYFRDVSGWEVPDWFAPAGQQPVIEKHSWGRENWFAFWEAEHLATRENVTLMDMSFMPKFLVQGKDSGRVLDYISANRVDGPVNRITYTPWLTHDGNLAADLTVTKLEEEMFLVVVTDTLHRHALTWLKRHIPDNAHAVVTDMTSAYVQVNLQGPRSRDLLQSVTDTDLSDTAFPFRDAREIAIGYGRALCVRITYVGELGYELYIPTEQAVHVYDILVAAGKAFRLTHAGLKALGSLRLEKGYRDYGHDMDNTDDPYAAGLGFAVRPDKPGGFIGQAACRAKKAAGPLKRRLAQVLVEDPEPMLYHAEIIFRNGKPVGYVRSGAFGHTLGGAVGLFMIEAEAPVDDAYVKDGRWEIDIAGKIYPVTVSLTPLYDPEMKKIKR